MNEPFESPTQAEPLSPQLGPMTGMRNSAPSPLLGGSPFPPIAEYGFLSDCETTALVAPGGAVEWLCLPRSDSPSVFGALLDRDAGAFRFGPSGISVPAARRYLPGTMVLETSWGTGAGWIVVRDALLVGGWHHEDDRSEWRREIDLLQYPKDEYQDDDGNQERDDH